MFAWPSFGTRKANPPLVALDEMAEAQRASVRSMGGRHHPGTTTAFAGIGSKLVLVRIDPLPQLFADRESLPVVRAAQVIAENSQKSDRNRCGDRVIRPSEKLDGHN